MVEAHAGLNKAWPGVVEALDLIGSTQIQGRCLAGRQSVQRLAGRRQRAGAVCRRRHRRGRRPQRPPRSAGGANPDRPGPHQSLAKDEFILEFKLPPRPPRSGDAYLRFIPRTEMDIAVVGCGISVTLDDERRLHRGACVAGRGGADRAAGAAEPADALIGHKLDDATLAALDAAAQAACKPINDKRGTIEYRTKVAGVLARRVAADRLRPRDGQGPAEHCRGSLTHEQASRFHHDQRRADRIPVRNRSRPCSMCCATKSA